MQHVDSLIAVSCQRCSTSSDTWHKMQLGAQRCSPNCASTVTVRGRIKSVKKCALVHTLCTPSEGYRDTVALVAIVQLSLSFLPLFPLQYGNLKRQGQKEPTTLSFRVDFFEMSCAQWPMRRTQTLKDTHVCLACRYCPYRQSCSFGKLF